MNINGPITSYELWSLLIQAVGFMCVALSIVLLAGQTRQMVKQTRLSAYDSLASGEFAINNLFIQSPEMYPYFYEGMPITRDHPEYFKAVAVAIALADFLETTGAVVQKSNLLHYPWWNSYMEDQFASSPILCQFLEAKRHWYDPRVYQAMLRAKARTSVTSIQSTTPIGIAPASMD